MNQAASAPPPSSRPRSGAWWNDARVRGVLYQVLVVGLAILVGWYLVSNLLSNLATRGIATGFDFLGREAGFGIGEHLIEYSPADSYGRALAVGLLNTLIVSIAGIVAASILGVVVGVARLSGNWLVARLATIYVELLRNIPCLLQLLFWYALITEALPGPRQALHPVAGVFLSNRGLKVPVPDWGGALWAMWGAFLVACVALVFLARWARKRQDATGRAFPIVWAGIGLVIGLPFVVWALGGAPTAMSVPELAGFDFKGGATLSPEFTALFLGLVLYTASFIAEIVRSGILAVPRGQTEAAMALGLSRAQALRLVILPQAMRVIIPPLTSQYLNLTKNSSLAVAIAYPDLVSVANTAINQTGQAIEGVAIIMGVYLVVSLSIALFMDWYNKKMALVSR